MSDIVTEVQRDTFRGHPVIRLPHGQREYGFTFGLKKARAFVAYQDAVRQFVDGEPITAGDVTTGVYRKKPVIGLPNGSRHGFTFGKAKAVTLLRYAAEITQFVADHSANDTGQTRANGLEVNP